MPWLLRDGQVLSTIELAESRRDRRRGLRGRNGFNGALLLRPARSVNTLGMHFAIDVAYCSPDLVVVETITMSRFRLGRPRPRAGCVIEAAAGAFERWGLRAGDQLEIR